MSQHRRSDTLTSLCTDAKSMFLDSRIQDINLHRFLPRVFYHTISPDPSNPFASFNRLSHILLRPMQLSKTLKAVFALAAMPTLMVAQPYVLELTDPITAASILLLHKEQALTNLFNVPRCGQICLFDPYFKAKLAPSCLARDPKKDGKERFQCFCKSRDYQRGVDECLKEQCSEEELAKVPSSSPCVFAIFTLKFIHTSIVFTCSLRGS